MPTLKEITDLALTVDESLPLSTTSTLTKKEQMVEILSRVVDFCGKPQNEKKPTALQVKGMLLEFCEENPWIYAEKKLLKKLCASALSNYSSDIIKTLIRRSDSMHDRGDLIHVMAMDHTISSEPEMNEIFDLLVGKNIPVPTDEEQRELIYHTRAASGMNAVKLALSFLNKKNEPALANFLLAQEVGGSVSLAKSFSPTRSSTSSRQLVDQQDALKKSLSACSNQALTAFFLSRITDAVSFEREVTWLVEMNRDEVLREVLQQRAAGFVGQLQNHAKILNLAVDKKFTKTFAALIEAGFDPARHDQGTVNPLAHASLTQSAMPLAAYIGAIKKKFGEQKVRALISETNAAGENVVVKNALSGKSYITALELLEKNGADFTQNYFANLSKVVADGHAGTFNFLLRHKPANITSAQIWGCLAQDKESFAIDLALLNYLRNAAPEITKNLNERVVIKSAALTAGSLHEICSKGGEETLIYYIAAMKRKDPTYDLRHHVNKEKLRKTPLYHALESNAYNGLIRILLESGANPNHIGSGLDALSMAVSRHETATVELLLKHGEISDDNIRKAAAELAKPENNNALLIQSFVETLPDARMHLLRDVGAQLLARSRESGLTNCINKIGKMSPSSTVEKDVNETTPLTSSSSSSYYTVNETRSADLPSTSPEQSTGFCARIYQLITNCFR